MRLKNVLVVDDDDSTLKLITYALQDNGFNIIKVMDGNTAVEYISKNIIEAAILDLSLPDMSGMDILRAIRASQFNRHVPVIILTSTDDKFDTVLALELGADDYILKPFHKRELIARLNLRLKRMNPNNSSSICKICFGNLCIDTENREVTKDNSIIQLTFKEFELLHLLASNPGKVFSRDNLMSQLWSDSYFAETRAIDMHISSLRKKLNDTSTKNNYIETVRGVGYRFRK